MDKKAILLKTLWGMYEDARANNNLGEARRILMDVAKIAGVYDEKKADDSFNLELAQMKDEDLDKLNAENT